MFRFYLGHLLYLYYIIWFLVIFGFCYHLFTFIHTFWLFLRVVFILSFSSCRIHNHIHTLTHSFALPRHTHLIFCLDLGFGLYITSDLDRFFSMALGFLYCYLKELWLWTLFRYRTLFMFDGLDIVFQFDMIYLMILVADYCIGALGLFLVSYIWYMILGWIFYRYIIFSLM